MAEGSLGAEPWPGTEALYWTEFRKTPSLEHAGMFSWSVNFAGAEGVSLGYTRIRLLGVFGSIPMTQPYWTFPPASWAKPLTSNTP